MDLNYVRAEMFDRCSYGKRLQLTWEPGPLVGPQPGAEVAR